MTPKLENIKNHMSSQTECKNIVPSESSGDYSRIYTELVNIFVCKSTLKTGEIT